MEIIKQFISDLRNEKNGLSFDQPWRIEENSMSVLVPILNKKQKKRKYITFSEAINVEVKDTGQIDYVHITNNESKPVLVCRGDIFRGKTQERAAIHDYIIMPTKSARVSVRCIHQSKGINNNAQMKYGGKLSSDIDLSSQGNTWNTVSNYVSTYYGSSTSSITGNYNVTLFPMYDTFSNWSINGTLRESNNQNYVQLDSFINNKNDNYVGMMDDLVDNIKNAMKKLPPIKNQVGVMFFNDNDLMGFEIYDSDESWSALKEDIVSKEGSTFLNKDDENLFEFKPSAVKKIINKKLNIEFEEKDIFNREYKLIQIKSEKYLGEGLVWENKVIHLSMWKNKK